MKKYSPTVIEKYKHISMNLCKSKISPTLLYSVLATSSACSLIAEAGC